MRFHRSRLDKVEQRADPPDDTRDPSPLMERVQCYLKGISDPLPDELRPTYRPEDSHDHKLQLFIDAVSTWQRSLGEDVSRFDDWALDFTEVGPNGVMKNTRRLISKRERKQMEKLNRESPYSLIERANRLLEGIGYKPTRPKQQMAEKPTLKVVT
jgi:hypothetical protein